MPDHPPDQRRGGYLVVGAGYTGHRVVERLPVERTVAATRPAVDLDTADPALPGLPPRYSVLYTVPPATDAAQDPRLPALLRALPAVPGRFVYLSTTGVYGDTGGRRVDETCEPAPLTERAAKRLAAEQLLAAWSESTGAQLVVLRVPGIYGPGRLGLERLERGEAVLQDGDAGPGNRIHVDDLVGCCLRALEPDTAPGLYNVGDGDHRSSSEFARLVARMAGLPPPPEISIAEARRSMNPGRLSFLEERRIVDTSRMRHELGYEPCYADPADGIRASLGER